MTIKLVRLTRNDKQTLGQLFVYDRMLRLFECCTLEAKHIPAGKYWVTKYDSPRFKRQVLLLHDVPKRSYIEIHHGNFYSDTEGCILVGDKHTDINGDGLHDVTFSVRTLNNLLDLVPDRIQLSIFE